jgi:hypothetical protein
MAKAINAQGIAQPLQANWNPSGFQRNAIESVSVRAG